MDLPGNLENNGGFGDLSNLPDIPQGKPAKGSKEAKSGGPKAVRRQKSGGGKLSAALMAGLGVLLLVVATGVILEFATDWGYFGYKKLIALMEASDAGKKKAPDATPPPPRPPSDVKPEELLAKDTYLAYRQGAEQQQTIADEGHRQEPVHPAAKAAAGVQAEFLAHLVIL